MIYNFDRFDIVVEAKESLGMYYFIPRNFSIQHDAIHDAALVASWIILLQNERMR